MHSENDGTSGHTENANCFLDSSEDCPLCANRHDPEGAHLCIVCKKLVHATVPCSYPFGEEGYGQKRVCYISKSAAIVLSTHLEENWRGQADKNVPTTVKPTNVSLGHSGSL